MLIKYVNFLGRVEKYTFDKNGHLIMIEDPDGKKSKYKIKKDGTMGNYEFIYKEGYFQRYNGKGELIKSGNKKRKK